MFFFFFFFFFFFLYGKKANFVEKFGTTIKSYNFRHPKNCRNYPKLNDVVLLLTNTSKNAAGMTNSVDPDQGLSDLGLHCLPSCLSENIGSLR